MKFTATVEYKILQTIYDFNSDSRIPQLSDILARVSNNSRNSIEVCITHLKARGLVATVGSRSSFCYYVTEAGIDRIKTLEIYDAKDKILEIYNKMFPIGD